MCWSKQRILPPQTEMFSEGGREISQLCQHLEGVKKKDSWTLQIVRGFQIPFVGQPVQERKPRVPSFPA